MRIRILDSVIPLALTLAGGVAWSQPLPDESRPAFLDALDEIRVPLAQPMELGELKDQVEVCLNGKPLAVAKLEGGERGYDPVPEDFANLPGTIQSALGEDAWNPTGRSTELTRRSDGVYELVVRLPKGRYEFKIARGGNWTLNYGQGFKTGGDNYVLKVPREQIVKFEVDFSRNTFRNSIDDPDLHAPSNVATPYLSKQRYQSIRIRLSQPLEPSQITQPLTVRLRNDQPRGVFARNALSHPAFVYEGSDLGAVYQRRATRFRLWSPIASSVSVVFYRSGTGPAKKEIAMERSQAGTWFVEVPGDLHGVFYQYKVESYGRIQFAADIYGKAATRDSSRSMVVNMELTKPVGWPARRPFEKSPTDAVIYEAHVRDFTISPKSGVSAELRGTYLGLVQPRTHVPGSVLPTGLEHLKRLGITHLHLLPIQDINPEHDGGYNWGYETCLFNVPEEHYALDPDNPLSHVREVRKMVMALHQAGIGVVMDVVYNHSMPPRGPGSAFWVTAPYYYFRTNDRGELLNESGVGNALDDSRPMVRKFIKDSLIYWAKEYGIDGFRFDLIGMFSVSANKEFARAIRSVNPYAVVYGEPWTGGGPVRFAKGDQRGTGVAVFNDNFRTIMRGTLDGSEPGFTMGGASNRSAREIALAGSIADFADSPAESVNYVSAHDNTTLWDKVRKSMGNAKPEDHIRAIRLNFAVILLSQGIPFIEGGTEIGRTKGMNHNSYNAGDAVNQFDWARLPAHNELIEYVRGLIELRKHHPMFRLKTAQEVHKHVRFEDGLANDLTAMHLKGVPGDAWHEAIVVLNGRQAVRTYRLPEGNWQVAVMPNKVSKGSLGSATGEVRLEPLSAWVFFR